ncbi:MAG: DUF4091 domain-containing protein [Oscillospiraceae bacterium]|nr:DUF4091 domain-containing protein [Oscillospiraceae bacterium]
MKKHTKYIFAVLLTLVMILGMIPVASADETAITTEQVITGLEIFYPYNTETIQRTGTPVSRFQALTFESARGEVESAQLILTPSFEVSSFELTMNSLKNEKGNTIPSWAFEVYTQHYVTITGSSNAPNYSSRHDMYHPESGKSGWDGVYPDGLIPQDAAIKAGENTIAAGNNQGIWVNLNVQNAAPGQYTGYADLTINDMAMQIPVAVHIYDVQLPEQVHTKSSVGIWWDQLQAGEGYIDGQLADAYFDYLVSKRIMPMDAWGVTNSAESLTGAIVNEFAVSPKIANYSIGVARDAEGYVNPEGLKVTLTTLINNNIEQIKAGNHINFFEKAYFSWIIDEPRNDTTYAKANVITSQLDAVKAELAPLLAEYPDLQESFMNLKHLVTAPNPTDKTYVVKNNFFGTSYFVNNNYGNTALTGDSYIYAPQYQWLHTEKQRAMYAGEQEVWWYGCLHPVSPYPTWHINAPLVAARLEGWMRYDYGIDGFVFACANMWGEYTEDLTEIVQHDYWDAYTKVFAPGDQILVLPGSEYGVYGPIGTIRIENIREANEDYEYLWMLQNEYGINDISAYTANLYEGTISTTDVSLYYNSRKNLLTQLESLSIAKNGKTQINPGEEGFVRGTALTPTVNQTISVGATEPMDLLAFDYKVTNNEKFDVAIMPDWFSYYGYYSFNTNGAVSNYTGVKVLRLDDGYYRVIFDMDALTAMNGEPTTQIDFLFLRGNTSQATGYIDNVRMAMHGDTELDAPFTEPTEPEGYVVLSENAKVNWLLNQDLYVDLNGFTLTGTIQTNGFKVYGMDSATNRYTCENMGYFACVNDQNQAVVPESEVKTDLSGEVMRYLTLETNEGFTFHRIYVGITKQSLAPSVTGVGYKAEFYADEMVRSQVESIGYDLWLEGGHVVSRSTEFQNQLTLRVKNFDTRNHGQTNLYATVWMNVNGKRIASSQCSVNLRQMVESIDANVVAYSLEQLQIVQDMIQANSTMQSWQVDRIRKALIIRGEAFASGVDKNILLNNKGILDTITFEYKVTNGGTINLAFMQDWFNFYSYYAFDAFGAVDNYAGITTQELDDGYIRVTVQLSQLNQVSGSPERMIDFLYIRGDWSDADGYIDNVSYTVYKPTEIFEGGSIVAGKDLTIHMGNAQAVTRMSFDYSITSGSFHIALLPDWSNYFGYFKFDANGEVGDYPGVLAQKINDTTWRVYFDMTQVTTIAGAPSPVITMLYVRGDWTSANGSISNICINDAAAVPPRGESFAASVNKTIDLSATGNVSTIRFDYKITEGTAINVALCPNWSSYYGYFAFTATGCTTAYNGVTTEVLEDGYIRVTIHIDALTDKVGTPSKAIDFLYIRGDWSDASGYIDNVIFA